MPASPDAKLLILDLDGTLVDSLQDIGEAVNHCLSLLGLSEFPVDSYRYMVGEGVPTLCQRALNGKHAHLLDRLIDLTRARYRSQCLKHTRPYPGVLDFVVEVARRGWTLAVLSNKPHAMTVRVVREFWPDGTFAHVQGYVREEHRKPSPYAVLKLCASLGIPPERTCLVGDTPTDVLTARNAGAQCIAVTWGFRTSADLEAAKAETIVETPAQVLAALDRL